MPTSMPTEVAAIKNKLEAGTWFYRVDFVLRDASEEHFCNDQAEFTYSGTVYERLPFTMSELTKGTGGELPTRVMSVGGEAVDSFLKPYIRAKGGLRGSTVTLTKVIHDHPAIDMSATSEVYKVADVDIGDKTIAVHLGYVRLRNQQVPMYQYQYIRCRVASEFKGALCGYSGVETTCDGTPGDCIARSNYARFNAETGLKPKTVRLA